MSPPDYVQFTYNYSNNYYTWSNGRSNDANVQEQLDRCFATVEGSILFPLALAIHLPNLAFDHQTIFVNLASLVKRQKGAFGSRFLFEAVEAGC